MGRKKNLTQRVLIIKTAYALFLEEGYDAVTTKQIAQTAGMAHSLLHYYYKTKSDLLTDVMNTLVAKLHSYMRKQGVDLADKLYAYGMFWRLLFDAITLNRKLVGLYLPALTDGLVCQRVTQYAIEKMAPFSPQSIEKVKLAPYVLSGATAQILQLHLDGQTEMDLKDTIAYVLESFYSASKMATAWTHATIGLIDSRMTPVFVRGFVDELHAMMEVANPND